MPESHLCSDEQLQALFEDNEARQVLHVGFGPVLTAKDHNGNYVFRDRMQKSLTANEEIHYDNLEKHMRKHIAPFL